MPVLLDVGNKDINYKTLTRTVGLSYVCNVNSVTHIPRLFVAGDTGAISIFPLPGQNSSSQGGQVHMPVDAIKKFFTLDKPPKSVKIKVDVFKQALKLTSYDFKNIFSYSGEFKTQLRSAKSTINVMNPRNDSIIKEGNKRVLKMQVKLDNIGSEKPNNDLVITGVRVLLSVGDGAYTFRVLITNSTLRRK